MKIHPALMLISTLSLVSCNSGGGNISASDQRAIDARAAGNAGCVFEDRQLCSQLIDQRASVAQFFNRGENPKLTERQKKVGKQSLTKRIVDAAATIRQCNKTDATAIALVQQMEIAGQEFSVQATSPVSSTSDCFLTRLGG
ncbi:MAG: hypothetical protein QM488_18895 [Rhizobiaceae bacterium]